MSGDVTLSVTVLSYNNASYMVDCLNSIERQGISDYEVFVVDDCSTDDSVQVIKDYIKDKPQFTLIEKEVNTGGAVSSQIGIERSTGKYCAIIDSDDIIADGAYKRLINRLETDDSDFVTGMPLQYVSGFYFSFLNSKEEMSAFVQNRVLEGDEKVKLATNAFYWNCIFRTEFIKSNGIKMPSGLLIADRIFMFDAVYKAKRISIDTGIVYYWRKRNNEDNLSIMDQRSEYSSITDRCISFEAQIRIMLENTEHGGSLNRGMWERSMRRLYYPLNELLRRPDIDKDLIRSICERYRLFLRTNAGFFMHLIDSGKIDALTSFYTASILDKDYDRVIDLIAEDGEKVSLTPGFIKKAKDPFAKKMLIRNTEVFTAAKICRIDGRLYIYVQKSGLFRNVKIDKIVATTRFYNERHYELEYDNTNDRFCINDLPEGAYQFVVNYSIDGDSFVAGMSRGNSSSVPLRYEEDDLIVKTSPTGGNPFTIMRKNRFSLLKKDGKIVLHVNQDEHEIRDLFFYNIYYNNKMKLEQVGEKLYAIEPDKLPEGSNILIVRFNDGICSMVYADQFISTIDFKIKYGDLFENKRIQIEK